MYRGVNKSHVKLQATNTWLVQVYVGGLLNQYTAINAKWASKTSKLESVIEATSSLY